MANRIPQLLGLLLLASSLLLLSACSSIGADSAPLVVEPINRPVPQMQPASYADFDTDERIPERITIPSIGLDTKVVDLGWSAATDPAGRIFNNWDVAAYAAGWHVNSDLLGAGGNVVLSGHNNILGAVFRELDQLDSGDVATIWSGGKALRL